MKTEEKRWLFCLVSIAGSWRHNISDDAWHFFYRLRGGTGGEEADRARKEYWPAVKQSAGTYGVKG
jgi:hypothetical protein